MPLTNPVIIKLNEITTLVQDKSKLNSSGGVSTTIPLKLFRLSLNKIKHKDTLLRIAINSDKISG